MLRYLLLLLLLGWLLLLAQVIICICTTTAKAGKQPTTTAFLLWLRRWLRLRWLQLHWRRLGCLYCLVLRPLLQVRCLLLAVLLLQPQVGVLEPQEVQGMCPSPPRGLLGTAALLAAPQE
jgi:hypothetical protein